ncbi:tRNA (guanine(37)-N1)-methyltransferase Trm5a [uncultured archaeon]|nr:tRNA (guanine(37)-N1)-methyltransferase Trm5a [uncultured archaeon]
MQKALPEELFESLSNRFCVIGDIAILTLPEELDVWQTEIAEAVLCRSKNIRTVLRKVSKLEGDRRIARFEHLAGNKSTVTEHTEFGFRYRLDISRVFFNGRLAFERSRVAAQVKAGERVLVPFAGVGPFVLPLAARGAHVVALEKNREACLWLAENAIENHMSARIAIVNGDAFLLKEMIREEFDRIVIPAPYGMDSILPVASSRAKSGGMVHFYTFKRRHQIEGLKKSYEDLGLKVLCCRSCGNVAPGVSRWAFDMMRC